MCNLVLMRQLEDPAFRSDRNALVTSTLGLTAVTMAIVRLRHSYIQGGGTDGEVEKFLTSPASSRWPGEFEADIGLREPVEKQCQPVVVGVWWSAKSIKRLASSTNRK